MHPTRTKRINKYLKKSRSFAERGKNNFVSFFIFIAVSALLLKDQTVLKIKKASEVLRPFTASFAIKDVGEVSAELSSNIA